MIKKFPVLVTFGLLLLSGCATTNMGMARLSLEPDGASGNAPFIVQGVIPHSPAVKAISIGDEIESIDGNPVTAASFYGELGPTHHFALIKDAKGNERKVPLRKLYNPAKHAAYVFPFKPGDTLLFPQQVPAYKQNLEGGYLVFGHASGLVSASMWPTNPEILEVYITTFAGQTCSDCSLKFVGLMDVSARSWLSPISHQLAATIIYPPLGRAPPMVNVPPPVQIGSSSVSNTTGTVYGNAYGNSLYGNYSANTTTTTTPYYDYSATNMALMTNLAAEIARARIERQNRDRINFQLERVGNFHTGLMNPGEREVAYFDFMIPSGFNGPYAVVISDGKHSGFVRFGVPQQ